MESLKTASWKMADIYLEDRYESPKFSFRLVLAMLNEQFGNRTGLNILDVGTAEAALPHFLLKHRPQDIYHGLEYDSMLVRLANERVPGCKTIQGDSNQMKDYADRRFRAVT